MEQYPSKINKDIVKRKLQQLEEYIEELESIAPDSIDLYVADRVKKRAIERLLQLSIECVSDINAHLLAKSANTVPSDYYSSFTKMGEFAIIPMDLAKEMAPAAGLRNKLVHEYGEVDDGKVFLSIKLATSVLPKYIAYIKRYIEES